MSHPLTATSVLDRELPALRARLIDLAAALDRIDRAEGSAAADPRLEQIRRSLAVLSGIAGDRAVAVQGIFSLPYEEDWQKKSKPAVR